MRQWLLTARDGIEKKVLRRIMGSVYERGGWRRHNEKLYSTYENPPTSRIKKRTCSTDEITKLKRRRRTEGGQSKTPGGWPKWKTTFGRWDTGFGKYLHKIYITGGKS